MRFLFVLHHFRIKNGVKKDVMYRIWVWLRHLLQSGTDEWVELKN